MLEEKLVDIETCEFNESCLINNSSSDIYDSNGLSSTPTFVNNANIHVKGNIFTQAHEHSTRRTSG